MQQLSSRAGYRSSVPVLTAKPATPVAARPVSRRITVLKVVSDDESKKQQTQAAAGEEDDINSRILSGEFTDAGSTKEKLTRPIRKALAQDPVGIGECLIWDPRLHWAAVGRGGTPESGSSSSSGHCCCQSAFWCRTPKDKTSSMECMVSQSKLRCIGHAWYRPS
jgi:hypothetical protein